MTIDKIWVPGLFVNAMFYFADVRDNVTYNELTTYYGKIHQATNRRP
jgi:hypothetical protein